MSDCCISAWSGKTWSLLPTYRRLIKRLSAVAGDYLTFYWPEEAATTDEGILHQSLSQVVEFEDFDKLHRHTIPIIMDSVSKIISSYPLNMQIEYRGLSVNRRGLDLVGYSADITRLLELRRRIESLHGKVMSDNTIRAACARWKTEPPQNILNAVQQETERWSEAVFGSIVISEWTVGTCTLLMRPGDRYDYATVRCPLIVHHRGNSPGIIIENNPIELKKLVSSGHYIELDIWTRGDRLFVGHDRPDVEVTYDWLLKVTPRAFIHCKDGTTFSRLKRWFGARGIAANLFYHTNEDYALSTGGWVITYPGKETFSEFLSMMPESAGRVPAKETCAAICSDKLALAEN